MLLRGLLAHAHRPATACASVPGRVLSEPARLVLLRHVHDWAEAAGFARDELISLDVLRARSYSVLPQHAMVKFERLWHVTRHKRGDPEKSALPTMLAEGQVGLRASYENALPPSPDALCS